jgi:hypothetical protein
MKLILTLLFALLCIPAFGQDQGESALLLTSGVVENVGNLGEYDFDANGTTGLTATGTPTLDSANAYTSPDAAHFVGASQYYTATFSTVTSFWARAYVKVNTISTSGTDEIMDLFASSGAQQLSVYLNTTNGHLSYYNQNTASGGSCTSVNFPTGAYHYIEVAWTASTTTGTLAMKLDGAASSCALTGINTGSLGVAKVKFGQAAANAGWDLDMDNVGFSSIGYLGAVTP